MTHLIVNWIGLAAGQTGKQGFLSTAATGMRAEIG
jgi:hypothetical protein